MTTQKLLKLLNKGENLNIEFKQRFSTHEKIAKEIIAFANTRGGFIIIGIEDNGVICGVQNEKGETELVKETAKNYCEPPISCKIFNLEVYKKEVVVVEIHESETKPHRIQDYKNELDLISAQVYVRVGEMSINASKEMIKLLQTNTNRVKLKNYNIGKNEQIVFSYLDEYESITVKDLSKTANLSSRRASRTLINLVRANLLLIHTKENGESFFTYAGE